MTPRPIGKPRPHVFISYAQKDGEEDYLVRVRALADRLKADGIDCEIDQDHDPEPPSKGWLIWAEEQVRTADFILVVCTAAYYRRTHADEAPGIGHGAIWEATAIAQRLYKGAGHNTSIIPVGFGSRNAVLDHIPYSLGSTSYYDILSDEDYATLIKRLKSQRPNVSQSSATEPAAGLASRITIPRTGHSALPEHNQFFTGRKEELAKIRAALTSDHKAAVTQAISGLGGIGKTALATEYAYEYHHQYDNLLFCRADSLTSLNSGYKALGEQLGLPEAAGNDMEVAVAAVLRYLNTAASDYGITPYLLILDNADFVEIYAKDLRPFLPRNPTGHILLTTRAHTLDGSLGIMPNHILRLGVMTEDEALLFLIERVRGVGETLSGDEPTAAAELAQELGYLPLALEQAAAYIAQSPMRTFRSYLSLYLKQSIAMVERKMPEAGGYEKSIATTWQISFDEVRHDSGAGEAATDLLRLCAFLASNAIPGEIVMAAASGIILSLTMFFNSLNDEAEIEDGFSRLLAPLMRYSLVTQSSASQSFSVHRLVQAVTKWQMSDENRQKWGRFAIQILDRAFPNTKYENWNICERLTPHVQAIASWIRSGGDGADQSPRLLNQTAFYLDDRGRYSEAEPLYAEVLKIYRDILLPGHSDIAKSLNNLAYLYNSQGRYSEAEPLFVEALEIYRNVLPQGNIDIAVSLNNLAYLYSRQNQHAKAEPLYVEALKIRRKELYKGHLDIALSLNNLAALYESQGRYSEAEPLFVEALQIRRDRLFEAHPEIATSLNNLAYLYNRQSRYNEAEPLFVEALRICRKSLPYGHPRLATSLNNLALFYNRMGRHEEAEPLLVEALTICQTSLGDKHPNTQIVQNSVIMFMLEKTLRTKGLSVADLDQAVNIEGLSPGEAMAKLLDN